jgi:hypothetical protein
MPVHVLKGVGPPDPKLQELIDYLFRPAPDEVKQVDLVCGRGRGKSIIAIDIACRVLSNDPNAVILFLEPDWKRINRVFLKKWRKIVPKELYTLNKGEQLITWLPTGALLYYGPRNITGSYEMSEDAQLGQDTTVVIDDEAALRCSQTLYTNTLATIRVPSDVRFYLTVTTPRIGPYQQLVTSPNHVLFRGKSRDNPYRPKGYVKTLMQNMSAEQARRELDGEFIALKGRVWKDAKYDPNPDNKDVAWPDGNRHDMFTKYDPGRPWWLFCDLGSATGAYAVLQKTEAIYRGTQLFREPVWVAVADFCPNSDASASRAMQMLNKHFGPPAGVVAGADINKRSEVDGSTVAYFAQKIWGNIRIYPCSETLYDRQLQYDTLSYLMCSANGERKFTIARDFVSLDTDLSRRGIREMIDWDQWPPLEKRRESDFLPKTKDIVVSHIRDALLMGSVMIMRPPQWVKTSKLAS